jgi:hypothetical protein
MADLQFTTVKGAGQSFRFEVRNPPPVGSLFRLSDGRVMTFQRIGMAGMLQCVDEQGSEQLIFPHQICGVEEPRHG